MGLGVKRRRSPCFCNEGCLPYTYPYDGYWINAFCINPPSYGNGHFLFLFKRIESDGSCLWLPPVDHLVPPGREEFRKIVLPAAPGFHKIQWQLTLFNAEGGNTWINEQEWQDPGFPPIKWGEEGDCSAIQFPLLHTVFGPACAGQVDAAYPDACDDNDYPSKVQRKPLTWQP